MMDVRAVAQLLALSPSSGEGASRPIGNKPTLLLGKSSVEVEHEGIRVDPELGDDERHLLHHQPGDEGNVSGQSVELGDDDRALGRASSGEGGCQLRPAIESIGALAGFDLGELGDPGEVLGLAEAGDGCLLGPDAEPAGGGEGGCCLSRGPFRPQSHYS